jgi:hypothetical protein
MPDLVMDRVRAANPARPGEFDGLADFESLVLEPRRRPRRRRRPLLALPAIVAAALAAIVLMPASAPQAKEVLRRAVNAMQIDDGGILYAETHARHSSGADYGVTRVWVRGADVRYQQYSGTGDVPAGSEEITHDGRLDRYAPDGKLVMSMRGGMVPGEIFRSAALLQAAKSGAQVSLQEAIVDGRDAYALSWREDPGIEMTLWVDRESYVPLRFVDHSKGTDTEGKPFDETLTESVLDFERLPDTPSNRRLLQLHGQ